MQKTGDIIINIAAYSLSVLIAAWSMYLSYTAGELLGDIFSQVTFVLIGVVFAVALLEGPRSWLFVPVIIFGVFFEMFGLFVVQQAAESRQNATPTQVLESKLQRYKEDKQAELSNYAPIKARADQKAAQGLALGSDILARQDAHKTAINAINEKIETTEIELYQNHGSIAYKSMADWASQLSERSIDEQDVSSAMSWLRSTAFLVCASFIYGMPRRRARHSRERRLAAAEAELVGPKGSHPHLEPYTPYVTTHAPQNFQEAVIASPIQQNYSLAVNPHTTALPTETELTLNSQQPTIEEPKQTLSPPNKQRLSAIEPETTQQVDNDKPSNNNEQHHSHNTNISDLPTTQSGGVAHLIQEHMKSEPVTPITINNEVSISEKEQKSVGSDIQTQHQIHTAMGFQHDGLDKKSDFTVASLVDKYAGNTRPAGNTVDNLANTNQESDEERYQRILEGVVQGHLSLMPKKWMNQLGLGNSSWEAFRDRAAEEGFIKKAGRSWVICDEPKQKHF